MYSKPIVTNKLELIHTAYKVDFDLHNNITILMGDSGSGKTTVFDIMQEAAVEDNRLLCINYISKTRDIDIEKIIADLLLIVEPRIDDAHDRLHQQVHP